MATSGRRFAPLDGLRAVAVLAVFLYHVGVHVGPLRVRGGFAGVDVFFVISGFLITGLLLDEQQADGRVARGRFYARRALRLLPALFLLVAAVLLLGVLTSTRTYLHQTLAGVPWVVLYVGNWDRAVVDAGSLGLLAHTWSLAVEEQFYLFAGLGLPLLFRRRRVAGIALLLAALADVVYRAAALHAGWSISRVYNGLDTHADGLLLGCALAFGWSERSRLRSPLLPPRLAQALLVGGAAALVAVCLGCSFDRPDGVDLGLTGGAFATGAILLGVLERPGGWFAAILGCRPLVWLGRRSYGFYLYSFPATIVIGAADHTGIGLWWRALVVAAASLVATGLSWRFVERPFLRLKDRLTPDRTAGAPP